MAVKTCREKRKTSLKIKEISHAIRRWICRARAEEKAAGLPQHGAEGGQGLARVRRARIHRVRGRRREAGQAYVIPAERQAEARRDGGVCLHRVQVACP